MGKFELKRGNRDSRNPNLDTMADGVNGPGHGDLHNNENDGVDGAGDLLNKHAPQNLSNHEESEI